ANLSQLHTFVCAPCVQRVLSFTKFYRFFESFVFYLLKKSKRLTKGEFDE
ncbi:MAG: YqeG family HAD IIIA-type phosphatase, partial [Longicatena sp.]